ncbi:MAG: NUDIX domain-containing protein [candidate division Zixibacteria bacterium]|nr:NUDIX domain-containing protein [candidate division Zixibacteria bacterium]
MVQHKNIGIESPGVNIAVIKKDPDGWKYLLLKRSPNESYGNFWGFITGGKRGNETIAQCVEREMQEEIGLAPSNMWATEYIIQFYEPENDKIWILPLIVADLEEDAKIVLSEENIEYRWLLPNKAKRLVSWKNLVRAIDDITEELEIFPARNWVQIHA